MLQISFPLYAMRAWVFISLASRQLANEAGSKLGNLKGS